MQICNTKTSYGLIAKILHWLMGVSIIAIWAVGFYASDLPKNAPDKSFLFNSHKSAGMAILMLVVIRLSWRLYDIKLKSPASLSKCTAFLAHSVHYLLYAFMFIQPLSGWAMSSAAGYSTNFFNVFTFPTLINKNLSSLKLYTYIHHKCAYILLILFLAHIAGALYHHFIIKDDTLKRML